MHRNARKPIIAYQIALRQEHNGEKGTLLHQDAGQRPALPDQVAYGLRRSVNKQRIFLSYSPTSSCAKPALKSVHNVIRLSLPFSEQLV